jgi:nucleotide-binding universal stress UspA family protein
MSEKRPIVVGVDTSARTEAALRWAVREAGARRASLRLVCAFEWVVPFGWLSVYADVPKLDLAYSRHVAERVLRDAGDLAAKLDPTVEVSTAAIEAEAVPALLDESSRAQAVVLGARHLTTVGSSLLGSVSAAVAARTACPAVVVHEAALPDTGLPVVVGVDGTEAAETLLGYGFGHASVHGAPLHAVLCWRPEVLARIMPDAGTTERAEAWLSAALAGWRERFPDVIVRSAVIENHPTVGLLDAATAAQLLVVGSRGRHALVGTLLGSVSQSVLHHASCPVAVVPTHG